MYSALQNLLSNAWKFTKDNTIAKITFGVKRENTERVYFVKDNGVGFDVAKFENIFVPFQRYHSQEEFKGTGIGLSIVKRIIERHGGRVWVESEEGSGTTFFFTLNKQ